MSTAGPPPAPCRPLTARRKTAFVAVLLIAAIVAGALLTEGAVRVRHWAKFGSMRSVEQTFHVDPATGLRMPIANKTIGNIRIDSRGFRSPEIAWPKPRGTIRLAFLGGSTTYCAEVSGNEMTWPHLVWRSLGEALPAARFDYVNAGVPGYGLRRIHQNLELRVKALEPDVIILYEATNDLSFDSLELARQRGLVGASEESWLSRYSMFWFLAERNLTVRRLQARALSSDQKLAYDPAQLSRGFERRLRELIAASRDVASLVSVVTFAPRLRRGQSADVQREAAVTALYFMPYMSIDGLLQGYEEYNRVIREVATATGALLIGGEERIPPDGLHYADSSHFTDAGSRVMAARVSEALLAAPAFQALVARVSSAR